MTVPRVFDSNTQQAMKWLEVLCKEEEITDERLAYAALRAALHQLRDRLTVDEAAHLGAQLPRLVRGIYYEGWEPATTPEKADREAFLEGVRNTSFAIISRSIRKSLRNLSGPQKHEIPQAECRVWLSEQESGDGSTA